MVDDNNNDMAWSLKKAMVVMPAMVCNKIAAAAAMTTYEGVQNIQEHQQQQINYILDHTNIHPYIHLHSHSHFFFTFLPYATTIKLAKHTAQRPTLLGTRP